MIQQSDRFISLKHVVGMVGISKAQVYKLMGLGRFPKQRLISSRCARWSEKEIHSWMENQEMGCSG